MKHFLLIHGGSHGAWCWERCVQLLREAGHRADAIDLPGHGADQTPRDTLSLDSYVNAVDVFIRRHPESKFCIVGHSLAGIVLPAAIVNNPNQITEAVFVAALVLNAGERVIDHVPEDRRPSYYELAKSSGDGTLLVSFELARTVFFNDLSDAEARSAYDKLTPQALSIYLEEMRISPSELQCKKHYVVCKQDHALGYQACLEFARSLGGSVTEIDSGHDVMLSQAENLVKILLAEA